MVTNCVLHVQYIPTDHYTYTYISVVSVQYNIIMCRAVYYYIIWFAAANDTIYYMLLSCCLLAIYLLFPAR